MKGYANKSENQSSTPDSNTQVSKQRPISEILQSYEMGRRIIQCESADEDLLQAKTAERASASVFLQQYRDSVQGFASQRESNSTELPRDLKTGIENLSGYSMDNVSVYYNSSKPAQLQALAYTQGDSIHIAPGQEKHLPHEAWHVVQQKQGRVQPTMQLKGVSINDNEALEKEADYNGASAMQMKFADSNKSQNSTNSSNQTVQLRLPASQNYNSDSNSNLAHLLPYEIDSLIKDASSKEGLQTILRRKLKEMSAEDEEKLLKQISDENRFCYVSVEKAISEGNSEVLLIISDEMIKIRKDFVIGNPYYYARTPSDESQVENLKQLVKNTDKVFERVLSGDKIGNIENVFGITNVDEAKANIKRGKEILQKPHTDGKILIDYSGTKDEIGVGAAANAAKGEVYLPLYVVDDSENKENQSTMFHESMHAGNPAIGDDGGYIGSPGFSTCSEDVKLKNAAHYEVLAQNILNDLPIDRFVPSDTSSSGTPTVASSSGTQVDSSSEIQVDSSSETQTNVSSRTQAEKETQTEEAKEIAYSKAQQSWTLGFWWHDQLMELFKYKSLWTSYSRFVPYISRLEDLTVHKRKNNINEFSSDLSKLPVTQIDLGLSEGVVRRLNRLMKYLSKGSTIEKVSSEMVDDIDAVDKNVEADFYIRRISYHYTNPENYMRDSKMVDIMSDIYEKKEYFKERDPDELESYEL